MRARWVGGLTVGSRVVSTVDAMVGAMVGSTANWRLSSAVKNAFSQRNMHFRSEHAWTLTAYPRIEKKNILGNIEQRQMHFRCRQSVRQTADRQRASRYRLHHHHRLHCRRVRPFGSAAGRERSDPELGSRSPQFSPAPLKDSIEKMY